MLLFLDSFIILAKGEHLLLFVSSYCLWILKLTEIASQAVCSRHLQKNSQVEDVALSPLVCLARWALLRQACISAASRQLSCLRIPCSWKLAVGQALVANSVTLDLDNNNSNALLCKGLPRGFGDPVGYRNYKQRFMHIKNAGASCVPADTQRNE